MTALLLLGPWTPLLFQGQEFASSGPFLYFADHSRELAPAVRRGRAEFLAQFPSVARRSARRLPDPGERGDVRAMQARHGRARDARRRAGACIAICWRLRRGDPVVGARRPASTGRPLADERSCCATSAARHGDRLLVVNLGPDRDLTIVPEPLLAPPEGTRWEWCGRATLRTTAARG